MGIDCKRFIGDTHEPFICAVCLDVADYPIMTSCEHVFCKDCFTSGSCPTCRGLVTHPKDFNRVLKQVYGSLKIKCVYDECKEVLKLDDRRSHETSCPTRKCGACGYVMGLDHNCVSSCKTKISALEWKVAQLTGERDTAREELARLKTVSGGQPKPPSFNFSFKPSP